MFNIISLQENANENQMRDHYTPVEQLQYERVTMQNTGKDVKELDYSYTAGENVKWQPL